MEGKTIIGNDVAASSFDVEVEKAKDFIWKNLDPDSKDKILLIIRKNSDPERNFKVSIDGSMRLNVDLV